MRQRASLYIISLETFVPDDHPLRRIRPLLDDQAIRRACRALYTPISRPSVRPSGCCWCWSAWFVRS